MENLILMIERQRRKLTDIVELYGHTSQQALECSQELDKLLILLFEAEQKGLTK